MTRYIARNIVAAGLAEICEVQLSYAIGRAEPCSVLVNTEGTGKKPEAEIEKLVRQHFPLTPKEIIETLNLRRRSILILPGMATSAVPSFPGSRKTGSTTSGRHHCSQA